MIEFIAVRGGQGRAVAQLDHYRLTSNHHWLSRGVELKHQLLDRVNLGKPEVRSFAPATDRDKCRRHLLEDSTLAGTARVDESESRGAVGLDRSLDRIRRASNGLGLQQRGVISRSNQRAIGDAYYGVSGYRYNPRAAVVSRLC